MSKRPSASQSSAMEGAAAQQDDNPRVAKSAKVSASVGSEQKDSAQAESKSGGEDRVYHGSCCCGAVRVELTGDPMMAGYCHCYHCRAFTSSEFSMYAMSPKDKFKIVGEENLNYVNLSKDEYPCSRGNCTKCGQAVLDKIGGMDFITVMGFIFRDKHTHKLPSEAFNPRVHIHYKNHVMSVPDGLPKYEAFPTPGQPEVGLMKDEK